MITTASLRTDLPEFQNTLFYPDFAVSFWLNIASQMINVARWGAQAPFTSVALVIATPGVGYVAGDTIVIEGGLAIQSSVVTVDAVGGSGAITSAHVSVFGSYTQLPPSPAAQDTTTGVGTGGTFTLTYKAAQNTLYDLGQEMFAAHHLVLERRAQAQAKNNAPPGTTVGPINNKSVDKVSVGYDVQAGIEPEAGHWNLTIYGTRFVRMLTMMGTGGIQVTGPMCFPPLSSAGAFAGPNTWPWLPQ